MSKPVDRLEQIGREISARVEKLDKIGVKAVDHVNSINHLLAEAEKLCETPEVFAAFKRDHCPDLSRSRTYELLAIKGGRKSLENIRASTRARVTKHRAGKKGVTDSVVRYNIERPEHRPEQAWHRSPVADHKCSD